MQYPPAGGYGYPPPHQPPTTMPPAAPYGAAPYGSYGGGAPQYGGYSGAPYAPAYGAYAPAPVPQVAPDHYTTQPFHKGGQHVLGRDRCPFYHKMGACRHFDSCTKVHEHPTSSRTIILPMMYPNPKITPFYIMKHGREIPGEYDKKYLKKHMEEFYEDVFMLIMEYGRIVDMKIVDNLCEHLLGNVYVKFEDDVAAQNAVDGLKEKMYNGILLLPELCPVHDFPDATCKEAGDGCKRAIQCNYWHPTPYPRPGSSLMKDLFAAQDKYWEKTKKREEKLRERTPPRRGASPPRHNHRREGGDDARLCHICGRTGHISKDCPMKDE